MYCENKTIETIIAYFNSIATDIVGIDPIKAKELNGVFTPVYRIEPCCGNTFLLQTDDFAYDKNKGEECISCGQYSELVIDTILSHRELLDLYRVPTDDNPLFYGADKKPENYVIPDCMSEDSDYDWLSVYRNHFQFLFNEKEQMFLDFAFAIRPNIFGDNEAANILSNRIAELDAPIMIAVLDFIRLEDEDRARHQN